MVWALRGLVSIGVLAVLFTVMDVSATWNTLTMVSGTAVLGTLLLFFAQVPLLAWRWVRIVGMLKGHLTMVHAFQMTLLGRFLNQVLPASFGGDAVRAWQSTRYGLNSVLAVHSVLIERFTGLVSLIAIVAVALLFVRPTMVPGGSQGGVLILLALFAAACAALAVVWLGRRRLRDRELFARPIAFLGDAVRTVREPKQFFWLFVGNTVSNLLSIGAAVTIGSSLGLEVELWVYAVVMPLSFIATILPISIAGWGVREGAMVSLLALFGVASTDALALSLLFGITLLVSALLGGLVWIPVTVGNAEEAAQ